MSKNAKALTFEQSINLLPLDFYPYLKLLSFHGFLPVDNIYIPELFQISFMTFAGMPPATVRAGTSLFTTAPAAITAPSPIVTP